VQEGKFARALPFDKELLGSNRAKLGDRNIFVKNIPKNINNPMELEKHFGNFCKHGSIKSAKISINKDHKSNGYGFVLVSDPRDVEEIIAGSDNKNEMVPLKFAPKDKRDFVKAYNNVYVKNIPPTWTEEDLNNTFKEFGEITSAFIVRNSKGDFVVKSENEEEKKEKTAFGFVCYGKRGDDNYGRECAAKAVDKLHGLKIDDEHTLYVKPALTKNERDQEKKKDMLRYKNSKKRCNLYVKNFPPPTTKEELEQLFAKYGEIESIRLN